MVGTGRQQFQDQFDDRFFPHIVEWGKQIDRIDADVCILMARKAACMLDAMQSFGMVGVPAQLASDRVLDMDTGWLRNLRVALVDDLLISGSSLRRAAEQLREAGAARVTTHVLCVDRTWFNPEVVQPTEPYITLDDKDALALSCQIVNGLSVTPRPYNVDWPLYDGISMPASDIDMLDSVGQWSTFDTTSSKQRQADVFSLTHEADRTVRDRLAERVGLGLDAARLVKVRTYGRRTAGEGHRVALRILPIVAFEGLSIASVDSIFRRCITGSRANLDSGPFITPNSRLRLVQFVLAAELGRMWIEDMRGECSLRGDLSVESNQMDFAFTPAAKPLVLDLMANGVTTESGPLAAPEVVCLEHEIPKGRFRGHDSWAVQAKLGEPFRWLYLNEELKARRILRDKGLEAFTDPQLTDALARLTRGYSLRELEDFVSRSDPDLDAQRVVSSFLDSAIDQGIVVPVTSVQNGAVVRAYRHGEDVNNGYTEHRMFGLMLDSLTKGLQASGQGSRGLSRLTVEKMCVLFLRLAVAERALVRYNGHLGEGGSIGVRYTRKGAVVQVGSTSLFAFNPDGDLTNLLVEDGTLKRGAKGRYVLGEINDQAPTTTTQESCAQEIGYLFGRLLGPTADPALKLPDLTLISTCADVHQTAAALAAELSIVERHYLSVRSRVSSMSKRDPGQAAAFLRANLVYEAVNNGAWKYRKHEDKAAAAIIARVGASLETKDPVYSAMWRRYWQYAEVSESRSAAPGLHDLVKAEGRWLLAARLHLMTVAASLVAASVGAKTFTEVEKADPELARGLRQAISQERAYGRNDERSPSRLIEAWVRSTASDFGDPAAVAVKALGWMDELIPFAARLLDRARAAVDTFGQPRSVITYSGAIFIQPSGGLGSAEFDRRVESKVSDIRHSFKGHVRLDRVRMEQAPAGVIVMAADSRRPFALATLAARVAAEVPAGIRLRIGIIPRLDPSDYVHNGDMSGMYYGSGFIARLAEVDKYLSSRRKSRVSICVFGTPEVVKESVEVCGQALAENGCGYAADATPEALRGFSVREMGVTPGAELIADVGLVAIVTEEMTAVVDWLAGQDHFQKWQDDESGRWYYTAVVSGSTRPLRVVATQAAEQGERSTIHAYDELSRFSPKLMLLTGIAGGVHPDLRCGDVVLATEVIDYERRAETPGGPSHRGTLFKVPVRVMHEFNNFFLQERREPAEIDGSGLVPGSTERVRVFRGPIGTGSAVIKDAGSEVLLWLRTFNDKVLAVETEAGGAGSFWFERGEALRVRACVVVRGISDHADVTKDDRWRRAASENVVATVRRLLAHCGDQLVGSRAGPTTLRPRTSQPKSGAKRRDEMPDKR